MRITAPPDGPICDFCSSPHVEWVFDTPQVKQPMPADLKELLPFEGWVSEPGWAACSPCKELVVQGNREALLTRSARRFREAHPEYREVPNVDVRRSIEEIQRAFWEHPHSAPRALPKH